MKSASEVTATVCDYGLYVELSRVLGRTFKKVYYCNPCWPEPFPKLNKAMLGEGFDEIEVCFSPFDHIDETDLFCFFDIGQGRLQTHLESLGFPVWGARMAEDLEFERAESKEVMAEHGLPIGPYEIVTGMDDLRKYLKENDDRYVKISKWRGHFETLKAKNYQYIEPKLDEVEAQLGPRKNSVDFIVEEPLPDKFEVAIDEFTVDGQFPSETLFGVEVKDEGYIGVFSQYNNIPEPLRRFDVAMSPVLRDYRAKTFISAETRIGKDKVPYVLDLCLRNPLPPTEIYESYYMNIPEIVWNGANGILVNPEPAAKWAAEILILSSWGAKAYQPIQFPKESEAFVKLRNAVKIDGRVYTMPQVGEAPEIGAVVGYGDTMESAIDMAKEIAGTVEGYYIEMPEHSLERAKEQIDMAKDFGTWVKE